MAEGNLKGVVTKNNRLIDGHKIIYMFKVYRLDVIERTFYPLEYDTQCGSIPTSWVIELKYERLIDANDSYTFSIKLRRKDSSDHRVKANMYASFYDVDDLPVFSPIASSQERMVHDDVLEGSVHNIRPSALSEMVTVEVTIVVEYCHTANDWQCASKFITDKNSINLSKL